MYATLAALCIAVIVIVHLAEQRSTRERALTQLSSITSTLAAQLNADHVRIVLEKYDGRGMVIKNTQDAWYYVLHDHLRKSAERNALTTPLRVVAYDSLKQELQVVITSEKEPEFRTPYTGRTAALMRAYGTTGTLKAKGEDGEDLVAHDPLYDRYGRMVGMVVAEGSTAAPFVTGTLLRNIGLAALLFGLAGIALFRSVGLWLRRADAANQALEERHEDITDSIAYVGKIQRAFVPSPKVYEELFEGSFVIDRPKDVVSGDFHWYHRVGPDTCYVAAADCTGHGLPGAMLSAIGCSLLNEIVTRHSDTDPAELLGMLNTRLVTTLHQQGRKQGAGDGMDVALCRIDRAKREILFAGAFRPLFWLHQGQLTVINGDRRPIGGAHHDLDRHFTGHRLAYTPGDRLYLFSDGYVDQFGGPSRTRFMASRLHALLNEYRDQPMDRQAELLEQAFLEWKGAEEQVDDVCMLGLAV